ncbi:serine hydrolase domain-containing protein [Nocardia thailandica]
MAQLLDSGEELGVSISVRVGERSVVDLWGGWRDVERTRPWRRDTIINVWACTQAVTSLAALMLVERNGLDLDTPVAHYWPEFGAAGKSGVLVRHILSHTSGLSGWVQPLDLEQMLDIPRATKCLAAQAAWWRPGTRSGLHLLNYGHLVGELVRRTDGRTLGRFVAEEIVNRLQADFRFGLPERERHRSSKLVAPTGQSGRRLVPDLSDPLVQGLAGPVATAEQAHSSTWRRAELGAANSHTNARALTRILSVVACGGVVGDTRFLSPETIELIFDPQSDGTDLVVGAHLRMGVGYLLPSGAIPFLPGCGTACWVGWGGSFVAVDTQRGLTISYVMNKMGPGLLTSSRTRAYIEAVYNVLG